MNLLHGLKMKKQASILTENIVFIILNLTFLVILAVFLFAKSSDAALLEEKYAKQIALMIDASRENMEIGIAMEDAIKKAEKNEFPLSNVVVIDGNRVSVQLREKGGYTYSFFNDVKPSVDVGPNGLFMIIRGGE
jgi:hypothetical protein